MANLSFEMDLNMGTTDLDMDIFDDLLPVNESFLNSYLQQLENSGVQRMIAFFAQYFTGNRAVICYDLFSFVLYVCQRCRWGKSLHTLVYRVGLSEHLVRQAGVCRLQSYT